MLCIWKKREKGFALAKKNISKPSRDKIIIYPIKGNKFLFYASKELIVYNGDSPYDAIYLVQYENNIDCIIQLSDLIITAFIYGLILE